MSFDDWTKKQNMTAEEVKLCQVAYELGLKNAKVRRKNEYPEIIQALFEPRSANIGFDTMRYKGDLICWFYKEVCICRERRCN